MNIANVRLVGLMMEATNFALNVIIVGKIIISKLFTIFSSKKIGDYNSCNAEL